MFQDSSIEEMPIVLDRIPDLRPAPEFDLPLREGEPNLQQSSLQCLRTLNSNHTIRRIQLHGDILFTVGSPTRHCSPETTQTIQAWNWRTSQLLGTFRGHTAPITAIALSSDGNTLVSGSRDRTIKVWNVQTYAEWLTLQGHRDEVTNIAISTDGQTLASSSRDRTLRIWNLTQEKTIHLLPCLTDAPLLKMAQTGRGLLKIEQYPEVLNLQTGETLFNWNWLKPCEQWLAVTPDWQSVATLLGRQVLIRKGATGEIRCRIQLDSLDRALHVAAISPDGDWFVAGFQRAVIHPKHRNYSARKNVLRIWETKTGRSLGCLSQTALGEGLWQSVKFNQQGNRLVTSVESGVKIWKCDR